MHFLARLITAVSLCVLVQTGCSDTSVPTQHYRIGIINPSSGLTEVVNGFKLGMAERGYTEGKNITYIEAGPLEISDVAATTRKIVAQDIDLLYTTTTRGTQIAKETLAGNKVPIVFAPVLDPEKSNIVNSLSNPGGNITGVKVGGSTTNAFQWLLNIMPDTKNIFIPFHCTDPAASMCFIELSLAAKKAGVTLEVLDVTNNDNLKTALNHIPEHSEAVWLLCSPLIYSNIKEIVDAARARKIPVAAATHLQEHGVMVSYGVNHHNLGKQSSHLVVQVLQGIPASEIPVETAEFALNINLPAAKELGITIPNHILQQANFITN